MTEQTEEPQPTTPSNVINAENRRAFKNADKKKQTMEFLAMRQVADQLNLTAQQALAICRGLINREISTSIVMAKEAALLIIYTEPGKDIRDDILDNIAKLMRLPVLVLPKGTELKDVQPEEMENAGWVRKIKVAE